MMKPAEVSMVIATLESALPPGRRGDEALRVAYAQWLAERDYAPAIAAAHALKVTVDWMPSLARFVESYEAERRRLSAMTAALPERSVIPTSTDRAKMRLAEVRHLVDSAQPAVALLGPLVSTRTRRDPIPPNVVPPCTCADCAPAEQAEQSQ